jgi:hypothetical protein
MNCATHRWRSQTPRIFPAPAVMLEIHFSPRSLSLHVNDIVLSLSRHLNLFSGDPLVTLMAAKLLNLFIISYCPWAGVSQYSVWLQTGRPGFDPWPRQRIFLLASESRPALGPIQPPVQWVPGVLSPGEKRGRGVMLTTHPHLVPRLRMSRSYTSSPPWSHHGV